MESLEGRALFSAGPKVTSIIADNRGQVKLTFNQALNATTVNANTARILTAGADGILNTADDVAVPASLQYGQNTLYITGNTSANQLYRIELLSGPTGVLGKNGRQLYGNAGPGGKGGNFEDETPRATFVARFNTTGGSMNVALSPNTPITNQNFLTYANSGAYDGSFFHRIEPSPTGTLNVLQGGGFNVNSTADTVGTVPSNAAIPLEVGGGKNLKGTIAMARTSDTNTGTTNEFFFNTLANPALDPSGTSNAGYAVFGKLTDAPSQATLNRLARPSRVVNLNGGSNGGSFGEVPVINYSGGAVDPAKNLEIIYRVAFPDGRTSLQPGRNHQPGCCPDAKHGPGFPHLYQWRSKPLGCPIWRKHLRR